MKIASARDARRVTLVAAFLFASCVAVAAQEVDSGVIRFGGTPSSEDTVATPRVGSAKRSFDYQAFEGRLEALWFQRKALIADGRLQDGGRSAEMIRSFTTEEGVHRLTPLAGALIRESERWTDEGNFAQANASLDLAQSFDPGNAQILRARASVRWRAGERVGAAMTWLAAQRVALTNRFADLTLLPRVGFLFLIASLVAGAAFALVMVGRYQKALRHEIEEWALQRMPARWAPAVGWAVLLAPLLVWFAAGWLILYWIAVCYRYMRRGERLAAATLILLLAASVPAYRVVVGLYGMSTDPVVQHTVGSADGAYAPERILELQALTEAYPDDPVYHFLLAGLYKNGRYFEEAFAAYRRALELDPSLEQAYINVGNIFYTTGQYAEAVAQYNRAIEVQPRSQLAYFNRHLAQSEAFDFDDAQASLAKARSLDSRALADLLLRAGDSREQPSVLDAELESGSVWRAALEGRKPREWAASDAPRQSWLGRQFLNPITILSLLMLAMFGVVSAVGDPAAVARRCIRCGCAFCHYCKSGRESHEYCSQCHHLYVLGDGLAPHTKARKLYEVERHERWTRRARRALSIVLPGSAQLLRGQTVAGVVLLIAWFACIFAWIPSSVDPLGTLLATDLRFDRLSEPAVPAVYAVQPVAILGLVGLGATWAFANLFRRRRGVA